MSVRVTWDSQEVKAWQRQISQQWARAEAPKLLAVAKAEAPKGGPFSGSFGEAPHPGRLKESHRVDIRKLGAYDSIVLTAETDYAMAVHEGRRAVTPRRVGGKLVWRNQYSGVVVSATRSPRSGRAVPANRWLIRAMRSRGYDIV